LILVGITLFLTQKTAFWKDYNKGFSDGAETNEITENYNFVFETYFLDYLNLWFALAVFFSSYLSYLLFKKNGYNFIEHFIINLYIFSQQTLLFIILMFPMMQFRSLMIFYFLISMVYTVWVYLGIFDDKKLNIIFKGSFANLIGSALFMLFQIFALGVIYYLIYLK
jgi:hypothetical protein